MLGGSRGRTSTSIQERRGLFWVRHEHLFPAKNRQNRKFYNRLTTKDMLRVFMGRTISGKRPNKEGSNLRIPLMPEGQIVSWKKGLTVTDAPFAESKEAIGGYFLLQGEGPVRPDLSLPWIPSPLAMRGSSM